MPTPPLPHLTAAEIAKLTGVSFPAVSTWRTRYKDFPEPPITIKGYPPHSCTRPAIAGSTTWNYQKVSQ